MQGRKKRLTYSLIMATSHTLSTKGLFDKSLGTAADLSKLLPTGTTLAFQTMAPSFSNRGLCNQDHHVNFAFTWGLIGFLTTLCAFLAFTDSVTDKEGNTYYGVATPWGFRLFNHHLEELRIFDVKDDTERRIKIQKLMESKRWRGRDFVHAFFSAAVFMALAFCDAGVQNCLVPKESTQWRAFLSNLPLAVGFLASFVFVIFPSVRNGIGDDGPADVVVKPKDPRKEPEEQPKPSDEQTMDIPRVVPSTSYELDEVV